MFKKIKISKDYIFKILKFNIKYLEQLNYNYAFLNDSTESFFLLKKALSRKIIKQNSLIINYKTKDDRACSNFFSNSNSLFRKNGLKKIDLIFILRKNQIDSFYLKNLVAKLKKKKKNIEIFDQTALTWEKWHKNKKSIYYFRKAKFLLKKNELIPSYNYNNFLIDYSKKIINKYKMKSLLDMGCGLGTIGISLSSETNIKKTHFIDINNHKKIVHKNALINNLKSQIEFTQSDVFSALTQKHKFDCIVSNPPYFYVDKKKFDPIGGDYRYNFIKNFFKDSYNYLTENGKIIYLKINDNLKTKQKFTKMNIFKKILKKNNFKLIKNLKIAGTIYELLLISK